MSSCSSAPPAGPRVTVAALDRLKDSLPAVVNDARRLSDLAHADVRVEVVEAKWAGAENGAGKAAGDDAALTVGVRVLAGERAVAPGYVGVTLGAADLARVEDRVRDALAAAHRRALASAEYKAAARDKLGVLGQALTDTRLHPVHVCRDTVAARYAIDPRAVDLDAMVRFTVAVCREAAAADPRVKHTWVSTLTQLSRELFVSTEGALIDQAFALTQGLVAVVAVEGQVSQELFDVIGHQRGWEVLESGVDEALMRLPSLRDFALGLAAESVALAGAPPLPTSDGEVVVVTDPHYNALLAHEIVGHPAELDRALKMETAYAGRSWLLRALDRHEIGRPVASPLVSAYSDPALPGYGHYLYDHEGTPGRRVDHIERGIFRGFMNSRQTAAVFGGAPNGHWKATDLSLVPLVRMSTTVFAAGEDDPARMLGDVDRGYYLMGHRTPSIAESRENFRISARAVREIRGGQLGQLYRDGGLTADTRDFLGNVDAVGHDLRLYPIPNCGKGQPMQSRRLGNGGPTLRSRARVIGG